MVRVLSLDTASPIPLYHQIAEALRYRIATGRLAAGEALPTVRDAAQLWGVHVHTVRRAYRILAEAGLLEARPGRGTRVVGRAGAARAPDALEAFLARVLEEARGEHELSADALASLLAGRGTRVVAPGGRRVHVLECNEPQCEGHARELEARWEVEAVPWCLARDEAPPEGPLVATWFHYNEVRRRWPHRLPHVRFATVRPAPGVADALLAAGARGSALLAELEPGIARDIAADVTALLPEGSLAVEPRVVEAGRAGELLERQPLPVLFSPRLWGALAPDERAHPRAVEVRYAFPPAELDAIGTHFGWTRRARARRSRHSAAPAR